MKSMRSMSLALVTLIALGGSAALSAEEGGGPTFAAAYDFVGPAVGLVTVLTNPGQYQAYLPFTADFQWKVADHFALAFLPTLLQTQYRNSTNWGTSMRGQLGLELDWHPFDTGFSGPFVGGQLYAVAANDLHYGSSGGIDTVGAEASTEIGLGISVGWNFLLPQGLFLGLAGGYGGGWIFGEGVTKTIGSSLVTTTPQSYFSSLHLLRLELSLGKAF